MSTFTLYFLPATWLSCEPPFNFARYPFSYILRKASLLDHWYQSNTTETTSQFYFFWQPRFPLILLKFRSSFKLTWAESSSEFFWSSVCPSVNFHIFIFSRTTGPISTKLGTKHPWVKGIQVCSNEGPRPSQRGDNWEMIKLNWQLLKIFFSKTTGPSSTKLGTKYP